MTFRLPTTLPRRSVLFGLIAAPVLGSMARSSSLVPPPKSLPLSLSHPIGSGEILPPPVSYSWPASRPLPISAVLSLPDGSTLYSRDVNRILCADSDSDTEQTWLGTARGIKQIDRKAGVVRHYGPSDGLPEGRIAAVATDASGQAWCIVQGAGDGVSPIRFYLCGFSPTGGANKWSVLRTIAPSANTLNSGSSPYYGGDFLSGQERDLLFRSGRPRIAVRGSDVLFTIGSAGASDAQAVYQWDRRTSDLQEIPWDAGLRIDNRLLFTTFVIPDTKNGGLWVGTNVGLLYRAAKNGSETPVWSRVLESDLIAEGAVSPTDNRLCIVTTPRTDAVGSPPQRQNQWKVYTVSGNRPSQVREETPPPAPDTTPDGTVRKQRDFLTGDAPNNTVPLSVTTDSKGVFWLTQKGIGMGATSIVMTSGPRVLDSWWRRDDATGAWTRYEMRLQSQRPGAVPEIEHYFLRETPPSGVLRDNVDPKRIPEDAVRALALLPFGYSFESDYNSRGGLDEISAAYGMRERFPEWICADDITAKISDLTGRITPPPNGPIPDPASPSGMVWTSDLSSTLLLHLPKSVMTDELRQARTAGISGYATTKFSPNDPKVESYPLPAPSQSPVLASLAVSPDSVFTVWYLKSDAASFAARLDRKTKQWTLYDESRGFPARGYGGRLIAAGSGAWLIHITGTYFLDTKRGLWRLAFGRPEVQLAQSGYVVPAVALREGNAAQTENTGGFTVADIAIDPKTGDSFVLANARASGPASAVVFRCDHDGRIITRSAFPPRPDAGSSMQGSVLLAEGGSVLVGTTRGLFRVGGTGTGTSWEQVNPPAGLPALSHITRQLRDPDGRGLYVMNNETVAFWRFP